MFEDEGGDGDGELEVGGDGTAGAEEDDLSVDPNQEHDRRRERYMCRPGPKLFMLATFTRDETGAGTPVVECRMVSVKDLRPSREGAYPRSDLYQDPPSDVGLTAKLKFHGTERAIGRMGHFAKTLGYKERIRFRPYGDDGKPDPDGEHDDVFTMIAAVCPFVGKVEVERSRDGKAEFAEIVDWKPYTQIERDAEGKPIIPQEWRDVVNKTIDDLERKEKERADKDAAKEARGGGRGRGKGGGGGSQEEEFGF